MSDFICHWNIPNERYPLVPLGIRRFEHVCVEAGEPQGRAYDAVSDLFDLSNAFSARPVSNSRGQAEHIRKVVKQFRLDARDPAVS